MSCTHHAHGLSAFGLWTPSPEVPACGPPRALRGWICGHEVRLCSPRKTSSELRPGSLHGFVETDPDQCRGPRNTLSTFHLPNLTSKQLPEELDVAPLDLMALLLILVAHPRLALRNPAWGNHFCLRKTECEHVQKRCRGRSRQLPNEFEKQSTDKFQSGAT